MLYILRNHPFRDSANIEKRYGTRNLELLKNISVFGVVLFLTLYLANFGRVWLGAGLITLGVGALFDLVWRFAVYFQDKNIESLPEDAKDLVKLDLPNTWPNFIDFASYIFLYGITDSKNKKEVVNAMIDSDFGNFFLLRTGINKEEFLQKCSMLSGELDLGQLASEAANSALRRGHRLMEPSDFLAAFSVCDKAFAGILLSWNLAEKDLDFIYHWFDTSKEHRRKTFLEALVDSPGIGKTLSYGYTPLLDMHSRAININQSDAEALHVVAHKKEISELEEALAKAELSNVLLVGEEGIGKMTIVKGMVGRIKQGKSFPVLNYRRILRLQMESIMSEKNKTGSASAALSKIFKEAERAGNVILVIEDIELYLESGTETTISEALFPFLRSPLIKIIGLTTPEGYSKSIGDKSQLKLLFNEVRLAEPDEETVIEILEDISLTEEKKIGARILYFTVRKIYELALHYISNVPFPEKAVNLLYQTLVFASESRARFVTPDMAESILERKFGVQIGEAGEAEKNVLINLEDLLHKSVINQEAGIKAIADGLRRKRAGISTQSRPAGTFLFLGPTGVGKTETAKALAKVYFGSADRVIRLDMSEYQNPQDMARLVGSMDANQPGYLSEKIRAQPFSLILLDEIEKAHPNILNLFLQILDEGAAKDAHSNRMDFTSSFIISTSNAGSEFIRESIKAGVSYEELQKKLLDVVLEKGIFRPEFVNRFDGVIIYTPLTHDHVRAVAVLLLKDLAKRIENDGYQFSWTDAALNSLAAAGYSEAFGAREMRRTIQEKVESKLAKDILSGKYQKGGTIAIDAKDIA
ncbi:MAG: AAA family ATPase [bacterium]|nr:AAA family ATPase [bacterium]